MAIEPERTGQDQRVVKQSMVMSGGVAGERVVGS